MTTKAQLRKAARALPETEEGERGGLPSFSVRGRVFASVNADGAVELPLPGDDAESVLAEFPAGAPLVRSGRPVGVTLPLADVNGMALNSLVYRAWRYRAPKRLTESLDSADRADRSGGDLPTAIGKPATRALHGAGVTTLDQVAERPESELLALHGFGPKAMRILNEALEKRGGR